MNIQIRPYQTQDAAQAAEVWNQVVEDGLLCVIVYYDSKFRL